jgi:hypothetical protein
VTADANINVDGEIRANGTTAKYGGGGAGGSVYLDCDTFAGDGLIQACGGTGYGYPTGDGGGGGGRIAVTYDTGAQAAVPVPGATFSVAGGSGRDTISSQSDIGTLYFSDNSFLGETIPHSGEWRVSGLTNWSTPSLTIDQGWFRFPAEDFELTVAGNMSVIGDPGTAADPFLSGRLELRPHAACSVGGDLALLGGGDLHLVSGATNATKDHGLLLDVSGEMSVGSNSWVYPYSDATSGGSPLFRVGGLTIDETGGFNANGLGYRGSVGSVGNGPGGGTVKSGGGHGGGGGQGSHGTPGGTYGDADAPVAAGSAGGAWNGTNYRSGDGGGVIRVEAEGNVTLRGDLAANGVYEVKYSGSGAGGSVYITCRTFRGHPSGSIEAKGGIGYPGGDCGGGGGGRIAVWRQKDASVDGGVTASSAGGTGSGSGTDGEDGSLVWGLLPAAGAYFILQ